MASYSNGTDVPPNNNMKNPRCSIAAMKCGWNSERNRCVLGTLCPLKEEEEDEDTSA